MQNADRRRINPPAGGTKPPVFISDINDPKPHPQRRRRARKAEDHRKIFLRTGIVPSASGSAYFETSPSPSSPPQSNLNASFTHTNPSLKLTCTVHGPRPLPRNAAFSPNLLLSTHIKFAPFATQHRRGYVRDASERDLGVHLETALRGVVVGERFPKSGVEVVVTVLEAEEDEGGKGVGLMGVLAGCVTVASAALVDAGVECLDLVSGGVAALVSGDGGGGGNQKGEVVLDPSPSEHSDEIRAACVVAYLQSRDELTKMWMKGDVGGEGEALVDAAVKAAMMTRTVLVEAVREGVELKIAKSGSADAMNGAIEDERKNAQVASVKTKGSGKGKDVVMTG